LGSYLRFLTLAAWRVQAAHWRRRYQVIHVNTMPDFMVATALLPRLFGARVILDVHDVMPEIYMTKFRLPAHHWKIRLIRAVEVLAARVSDAVLTAEHPKADLLAEHGVPRDKIRVLLNLPDDALFPLQFVVPEPALVGSEAVDPHAEFRLVYHGTLTHRLGLDQAVAALDALREELPGLRLQLFGEGDQLPELHRQVDELGLQARVWFSDGFRPIEEIIPELRRAHLALLPTRHEVSTDTMLPTKLLEYLACGVPALLTPTATVRHYFGDTHPLYLEDPQPQKIAAKIRWVRHHYADAKQMTAALQSEWFARYHWPDHKKVYLDLLADLAK
jgi:glycosyltransferase involved in cell wall biosynthesis